MEYLKQIQKHIDNHRLPSIVSLWEEYCMGDDIDLEELKRILLAIKESPLAESFGCYVEHVLPLWDSLPESDAKHEIFRLVVDMQTSNDESLRNKVYNYLHERYKDHTHFNQKIRLIGLKDKPNFQKAVSNFELLTHMEVGNFVYHTAGWGVGEVMEVSLVREQLILEFDYVPGKKDLSFKNAFNTLLPIPKDHFLARRFGDPDILEEKAKKDPVFVIRILLRDLGPKTAAEIKDELCELVIPETDWSKWWQNARSKLKKDTMIEVPSSIKDCFKLRQTEVSHEERLQVALKKKPTVKTLIEMVYTFIRDFPASLKNQEFVTSLKEELSEVLTHQELTDGQELQIRFFLQDLVPNENNHSEYHLIEKLANVPEIVNSLDIIAYKKKALTLVRKLRKDWVEIFVDLLGTIDHNPLRDYIMTELIKNDHSDKFIKKVLSIAEYPLQNPQLVLWYFQKILSKKEKDQVPLSDQEGKNLFLEAFFTLLHQLEGESNTRELVKKMHHMLTSGRYSMIRKIFEGADKTSIKEFLLLASKCLSLSDHDKKILHSLAQVVHPSLGKGETEEVDESVIWTTEEGFRKVKERIHHIGTVETVDNAKEIEIARSHGDLRENSEYKFALERRQRLQSELKLLSDQVNKARVITKDDVSTDQVGVGNIIHFKNDQGTTTTYTLLGPWDADADNNILSFQSKIAQALKGSKVGDKCLIGNQEWTITQINSYFE